jgi:hypothetical protein
MAGATGTADAVIAAARKHLGEPTPDNYCASFVTKAFKEGGSPSAFSGSSRVSTIAGQFSAERQSTDMSTARSGDLIVFGEDEHIAIYTLNGMVIGTVGANDVQGQALTKVMEVRADTIMTIKHKTTPTITRVLHTGLVASLVLQASNGTGMMKTGGLEGGLINIGNDLAAFGSFAWLPGLAANGAVLIVVLVLAVSGLRQVVDASG